MISVVIPVRNRAELVKRTLQSIAEQTVAPEQVILVDNGSTDGTLAVLQDWAKGRNARVTSEPTPGAARARNAGLALVTTPYVMFFDSDDVMPPRHIEQVSEGLKTNGMPQIGVFDMVLIGTNGKRYPKPYRHGDPMEMQLFHSTLASLRYVVNTGHINAMGGWNEAIGGWDDWELGVRLLISRPTMCYLPLEQPTVAYAQAESITGTSFSEKHGQWERALDAVEQTLQGTKYRRLVDYRRAILAGMYRREGHPEYARGLTNEWRMRLIERYVALGGRGVAYLSKIFS